MTLALSTLLSDSVVLYFKEMNTLLSLFTSSIGGQWSVNQYLNDSLKVTSSFLFLHTWELFLDNINYFIDDRNLRFVVQFLFIYLQILCDQLGIFYGRFAQFRVDS